MSFQSLSPKTAVRYTGYFALLVVTLVTSACGRESSGAAGTLPNSAETSTSTPGAPSREAGTYAFDAGGIDAVVVSDGHQELPNNGAFLGSGQSPEALAAVMREAGVPERTMELDFNALLLRTGGRVALVDTGFGSGTPFAGQLVGNLARIGVTPEQVTDVIITHAHPDHIGGVVNAQGALSFPNARVHLTSLEWEYLGTLNEGNAAVGRSAIKPRLVYASFGEPILYGVVPVPAPGHTPGQMALRIGNGPASVLYISDAAHHYVLSLARPEWMAGSDVSGPAAVRTRRALLTRAAAENTLVLGYHFPFPGLGRVRAVEGGRFAWIPEPAR